MRSGGIVERWKGSEGLNLSLRRGGRGESIKKENIYLIKLGEGRTRGGDSGAPRGKNISVLP